jgi:hypothetical protein
MATPLAKAPTPVTPSWLTRAIDAVRGGRPLGGGQRASAANARISTSIYGRSSGICRIVARTVG